MCSKSNTILFIISNEPWCDIWFSKQHYANELANLEFQVYFINPVKFWSIRNLFSFKTKIVKIKDNLYTLDYHNNLPLRIFPKTFQQINDWINSFKIFKKFEDCHLILWQFDPTRFIHIYTIKNYSRIYHIVDPMDTFWGDKIIAQNTDLIVAVREEFISSYKQYNNNLIFIPHGVGDDEFKLAPDQLQNIRFNYESDILFVGTINPDVDIQLILTLANNFTNQKILIIGPLSVNITSEQSQLFDQLIRCENVVYLNKRPANELKYYIASTKICIVPYQANNQHFKRTPLKIIHYLAQYKPVISTVRLMELDEKAVFFVENYEEFISRVEDVLNGRLKINRNFTEEYLTRISYPNLIDKILSHLESNS